MRKQLLIDGENYVHSLVESLESSKCIKRRQNLKKIDLLTLFEGTGIDARKSSYYMTRIKMPVKTHKLYKSANQMRLWNKRWLPYHANQGVKLVRAGQLKVRDGKTCKSCGKSTEVLLEKGVDVKIAVDLVGADGIVYLFSSDSDLIPAVLAAKIAKVKVIYVCIEGQINKAMQKASDKTIILSNSQVEKAFKKANQRKKHG